MIFNKKEKKVTNDVAEALAADLATGEDSLLEANQKLNALIIRLEDDNEKLKNIVTTLTHEKTVALNQLNGANDDLSELSKVCEHNLNLLAKATKRLESGAGGLPEGDCVVLDGQVFKIIGRYMAKWLGVEVLRKHVDEDKTVVVLDRVGD